MHGRWMWVWIGAGCGAAPDEGASPAPSDDPTALHALRHQAGPAVEAAYRRGLADRAGVVQRAAVSRLAERGLGVEGRAVVRDLAEAGEIHGANLQVTVDALAERPDDATARAALGALWAHPEGDPRSRARIRALLAP